MTVEAVRRPPPINMVNADVVRPKARLLALLGLAPATAIRGTDLPVASLRSKERPCHYSPRRWETDLGCEVPAEPLAMHRLGRRLVVPGNRAPLHAALYRAISHWLLKEEPLLTTNSDRNVFLLPALIFCLPHFILTEHAFSVTVAGLSRSTSRPIRDRLRSRC